jgi:hypothetical protein
MNAVIPYTAGRQYTPCDPAYTNIPAEGVCAVLPTDGTIPVTAVGFKGSLINHLMNIPP